MLCISPATKKKKGNSYKNSKAKNELVLGLRKKNKQHPSKFLLIIANRQIINLAFLPCAPSSHCPLTSLRRVSLRRFWDNQFSYIYMYRTVLPTQHTRILTDVLKSDKLPFTAWATFVFEGLSHTYFSYSLKWKSNQHIRKLQAKKHKFWWSLRFRHPMLASKCR